MRRGARHRYLDRVRAEVARTHVALAGRADEWLKPLDRSRVSQTLSSRTVRRPRCRGAGACRIIRPGWHRSTTLAERVRRSGEFVCVLRASELYAGRAGGLDPSPTVSLHAGSIDLFRSNPVLRGLRLLDELVAVASEGDETASGLTRFPIVLPTPRQKDAERQSE
jgi:hypothetical protein